MLLAGIGAATASAGTVCSGDVCVITGGFTSLQADIAASGAPPAVTRLLSDEVALAQRLHPPGPCFAGELHPPNPCLPTYRYFASAAVLVLVDVQVRILGSLPVTAAQVIDGDIQTMFADPSMYPPGPSSLPATPPGPPN